MVQTSREMRTGLPKWQGHPSGLRSAAGLGRGGRGGGREACHRVKKLVISSPAHVDDARRASTTCSLTSVGATRGHLQPKSLTSSDRVRFDLSAGGLCHVPSPPPPPLHHSVPPRRADLRKPSLTELSCDGQLSCVVYHRLRGSRTARAAEYCLFVSRCRHVRLSWAVEGFCDDAVTAVT